MGIPDPLGELKHFRDRLAAIRGLLLRGGDVRGREEGKSGEKKGQVEGGEGGKGGMKERGGAAFHPI